MGNKNRNFTENGRYRVDIQLYLLFLQSIGLIASMCERPDANTARKRCNQAPVESVCIFREPAIALAGACAVAEGVSSVLRKKGLPACRPADAHQLLEISQRLQVVSIIIKFELATRSAFLIMK